MCAKQSKAKQSKAQHSTVFPLTLENAYRAAASIATASMPASHAASIAAWVSRNGASVVQEGPIRTGKPAALSDFRASSTSRGSAKFGGWQIAIAGPFAAERTVDDDKIRVRLYWHYLAGGSHTDEETASGSKRLFCNKNRKCRTHSAGNDSILIGLVTEGKELGRVARLCRMTVCAS